LLSCDTNPRFHGGCFGVWGTPPSKPLNCKIRFARGAIIGRSWAYHAGDDSTLVFAIFSLPSADITRMSFLSLFTVSSSLPFTPSVTREIKNPAYVSASGAEKIYVASRYLLTSCLSELPLDCCPTIRDRPGRNTPCAPYRR